MNPLQFRLASLRRRLRLVIAFRGLALPLAVPTLQSSGNTQEVGLALYRSYMLPVEIASILLLVAMIGAVIMAKRKLE